MFTGGRSNDDHQGRFNHVIRPWTRPGGPDAPALRLTALQHHCTEWRDSRLCVGISGEWKRRFGMEGYHRYSFIEAIKCDKMCKVNDMFVLRIRGAYWMVVIRNIDIPQPKNAIKQLKMISPIGSFL